MNRYVRKHSKGHRRKKWGKISKWSTNKKTQWLKRKSYLIPGLGSSSGERNDNPTPVFLPGEFHGQRSLADYSPWGHKESDTTEWLTLSPPL